MRVFKIFIVVLLIITATAGGVVWRLKEVIFPEEARQLIVKPGEKNTEENNVSLKFDPVLGTVNILIVGLDDVDGGRRSDAIALAVLDQDNNAIRIASIPRDSRVRIPGRGWDKINHSYAYGGVDLLKQTVEDLVGVGINYFVVVNYQSFPKIIDLLGGIDIDVEKKLLYTDFSAKLFINIPKGPQHMNGKTALEYVRFRHDPLGDIGRVQRQQKFISIVMDKLKSPSILPMIPSLVGEVVSAVNTDLTPMQALKLAQFANALPPERIKLFMAPGNAAYIGNLSYWIVDIVKLSLLLAGEAEEVSISGIESEDVVDAVLNREDIPDLVSKIGKIGILNGDGASGLGKRASQIFQKLGVDVAYTGNARHFDYHNSSVVYPPSATQSDRQAAAALAKLCGITNKGLIREANTASMVSVILGHDKESVFKRLEANDF